VDGYGAAVGDSFGTAVNPRATVATKDVARLVERLRRIETAAAVVRSWASARYPKTPITFVEPIAKLLAEIEKGGN
jgi:hypothetical protein